MEGSHLINPYRGAFYQRQAEWHRYESPESVLRLHQTRARYYDWYTRGWLPQDRNTRILDIGCGSGQFLYFLKERGFTRAEGIDLDRTQVEIARTLGLKAECVDASSYLDRAGDDYGFIAMLDIIEHFRRDELFPLMETIVSRLQVGGRLVASVPNAESPVGLPCYFADITHEMAYTAGSLEEMLFCHDLKVVAFRDPWPAPIDLPRALYRQGALTMRTLAGLLRYRALGLEPPRLWSNVFWVLAEKGAAKAVGPALAHAEMAGGLRAQGVWSTNPLTVSDSPAGPSPG